MRPTSRTATLPYDVCAALRGRDLLSIRDLTREELLALLGLAEEMRHEPSQYGRALAGKTLATIFEKPPGRRCSNGTRSRCTARRGRSRSRSSS